MNKNTMLIGLVVLVILGAGAYALSKSQSTQTDQNTQTNQEAIDVTKENKPTDEQKMEEKNDIEPTESQTATNTDENMKENAKTITIEAEDFSFSVKEIRVKKGDVVKIVLKNNKGFHDWVIDEFKARTKQIKVGESDTAEFIADKTGTFEYYCSVGKHRQMGMKGNLIVE